jgi:hypothetical protein
VDKEMRKKIRRKPVRLDESIEYPKVTKERGEWTKTEGFPLEFFWDHVLKLRREKKEVRR